VIHFKPKELIENPVGTELKILYHWQNPKVINRFGGPQRHTQSRLSTTGDEILPSVSAINQAPHEGQFSVRIANIALVIFEQMCKLAGDVWLQIAGISAPVYQVRRLDANQPFENSPAQRRLTVPDILEFLTISRITDVEETPEETIYVVPAQQFVDRSHVDP